MSPEAAQAVIAGVIAIVAVWQIVAARRLAKITSELTHQVHMIEVDLDQSVQRLHRARELITKAHVADIFYLTQTISATPDIALINKMTAKRSAYGAELRGLAFAINDQELLAIVNEVREELDPKEDKSIAFMMKEMKLRNRTQRLHTRVYQLLEMAPQKKILS